MPASDSPGPVTLEPYTVPECNESPSVAPENVTDPAKAGTAEDLPTDTSESSRADEPFGDHHWLAQYFEPMGKPRLYELVHEYRSPLGEYAGVLNALAEKRPITLIVNHSQLDERARSLIEPLRANGTAEPISQSILGARLDKSDDLWKLINACLGQDAIICVSCKNEISIQSLADYANSLSFPSLFGHHVSATTSPARQFLLHLQAFALFEWNREGRVCLLI
jgi:hypothetical protein